MCRSLKWRAILRGVYALNVGFKMKPLRISVFLCYDKNNSHFAVKFVERTSHVFSICLKTHLVQKDKL